MKIGEYIQKRRQGRGLTISDVALETSDPESATQWLEAVEAGVMMPIEQDLYMLWQVIGFAPDVAMTILEEKPVQICRQCACSDFDACIDEHGHGCYWIAPDLCSSCAWTGD